MNIITYTTQQTVQLCSNISHSCSSIRHLSALGIHYLITPVQCYISHSCVAVCFRIINCVARCTARLLYTDTRDAIHAARRYSCEKVSRVPLSSESSFRWTKSRNKFEPRRKLYEQNMDVVPWMVVAQL